MSFNIDKKEKIEKVLGIIKKKKIKFCLLQFLSIEGTLKSIGINSNRIEEVLYSGEGFDGSSITGYGRLEESDMVAVPDPDTFGLIPWRNEEETDAFAKAHGVEYSNLAEVGTYIAKLEKYNKKPRTVITTCGEIFTLNIIINKK